MTWLRDFAVVVALAVCIFHGVRAQATNFYKCSEGPAPIEVRINGIQTTPIVLKKEEEARIEITFLNKAVADVLIPQVMAHFLLFNIPFDFGKNTCDRLTNAKCPVPENTTVTWSMPMVIPPEAPLTTMRVEFSLRDSKKIPHVCCGLEIKIVE